MAIVGTGFGEETVFPGYLLERLGKLLGTGTGAAASIVLLTSGWLGVVRIADVRAQVALSIFTDWQNFSVFEPAALHEKSVTALLDRLVAWSGAFKPLRG